MEYLVDSNVLIGYIFERFETKQLDELDEIFNKSFYISIITKIEVLGYVGNPEDDALLKDLVSSAVILGINDDVADQTIKLKQIVKTKTPDAIIAATAVAHNMALLTNNISDFKRIPDLKLQNPYEL